MSLTFLLLLACVALGIVLWRQSERLGALEEDLRRVHQHLDALSGARRHRDVAAAEAALDAAPRAPAPAPAPAPTPPAAPVPGPTATPVAAPAGASAHVSQPPPLPPRAAEDLVPAPTPAWVTAARDWLFGGNLVVRVGVVVLFFGLAFLLRYAAEHTEVPIEWRLVGVAIAGLGLLGFGYRQRSLRPGFALAVQGAGIGVLYLTTYTALRLFGVLPAGIAFALLAVIAAGAAWLALRQDSMALAVLGSAGGFMAPVLASTGAGNHVVLFAYYALLDLGILAIAWRRAWRPLNLLAFAFTFGISAAWGVMRYTTADWASTQPFLAAYFLMFVAITVLFAWQRSGTRRDAIDGTLLFGVPAATMALQAGLVRDFEHGDAWSAAGLAVFYLGLAALVRRRNDAPPRLGAAFAGIGVALATLAVPLAFDDHWTAATWALEGAALTWLGLRQGRHLPVTSGVALVLVSGVLHALQPGAVLEAPLLANRAFLGSLLQAVAGFVAGGLLWHAAQDKAGKPVVTAAHGVASDALLAWGVGWWLAATGTELVRVVDLRWEPAALLALVALSALGCSVASRPARWPRLAWPALALVPALAGAVLLWAMTQAHPGADGGFLAWPLAVVVALAILYLHDGLRPTVLAPLHLTLGLTALALLAWEAGWQADQWSQGLAAWTLAATTLPVVLALALLGGEAGAERWPLANHREAWRGGVAGVTAAAGLAAYWWSTFALDGTATPLAYLPLLNPLELAGLAFLAAAATWWHRQGAAAVDADANARQVAAGVLSASAFAGLNGMLLRSLHHFAGVPFHLEAWWRSTLVQTSVSILWSLVALGAMVWAARRVQRSAWMAGAALLAIVVLKLFAVDLSGVGTIERIASFMGVGVLMLAVGYTSPLPPRAKSATAGPAT